MRWALVLLAVSCAAVAPAMAHLTLRCPDGKADVLIDGAPAGKAEDYARRSMSLRPGKHRIEVRGTDGVSEIREADLGPGDKVALNLLGAGASK